LDDAIVLFASCKAGSGGQRAPVVFKNGRRGVHGATSLLPGDRCGRMV
jgi:hypothetical protein